MQNGQKLIKMIHQYDIAHAENQSKNWPINLVNSLRQWCAAENQILNYKLQ